MKLHTLQDLLLHQMRDVYYAEKQIYKALPKLARAATNAELHDAFEEHRQQTATHITRLESAFKSMGAAAKAVRCPAIEGLISEANELLDMTAEPGVMDAALIASAQRVEHYEIAAYGCIRSFADQLGLRKVADLVQQTIEEEGSTDKILTQLAESAVNPSAVEPGVATTA